MKRNNGSRLFGVTLLAVALTIAGPSSAFAKATKRSTDHIRGPESARPAPSYVGDCGPNYPPGYRYDLKNWTSRFAERDFSCYVLDEY